MLQFHNCEQQQKMPRLCIERYDSQRNALDAKIRTCLNITLHINSVSCLLLCRLTIPALLKNARREF